MKKTILIREDGTVQFIHDSTTAAAFDGERVLKRRASHVEPSSAILRALFHAARRLFGESGVVSDATRRLPCLWRVNLSPSGGPTFGCFQGRDEAINTELEWLRRNLEL